MSLIAVENHLKFVEKVVACEADLPSAIDLAELKSKLVSHGVVLLYAHMEQCLRRALETKCEHCADVEVRAFALSVKDEKTGRIGLAEVKHTLKRFGVACKEEFKEDLEKLGLQESWDSVMNQRHRVAHYGEPASLTLTELSGYFGDVRKVLGLVCKALGLNETEVAKISILIELPPQATAAVPTE